MPVATLQAYRTPPLQALSFRFAVESEDDDLGRHVHAVLAGLRDECAVGETPHWYRVRHRGGGFDVWRDGVAVCVGVAACDVAGWIVWDVNRGAVEASGDDLLFHAAALEAGGLGVLLPGASGSGKSTLAAALAGAGLGYLSDELVAYDLTNGLLLPYPKPISLKKGSFGVLAHLDPRAAGDRVSPRWWGMREWQVAVGDRSGLRIGEPCPPRLVVAPRFRPGAPTAVARMTETEAFLTAAANAVNPAPHGARGTQALASFAASCRCASITYSDLDDARRAVLDLVHDLAG